MEIIQKSNLKMKALILILIATLLIGVSAPLYTVKATETDGQMAEETLNIGLNRKVKFTGKTYKYSFSDKVKKEYEEGKEGCGIIGSILKNKKHPIYIIGEGWIDENQIILESVEKFVTVKVEKEDDKFGATTSININGEFLKVESTNEAVISIEDGVITAKDNGRATVNLVKKDGTEMEVVATVYDGGFTLDIPQKSAEIDIKELDLAIADNKLEIEASGNTELFITENGIGVKSEGGAAVTVDGTEVAKVEENANATLEIAVTDNAVGLEVKGDATLNVKDEEVAKIEAKSQLTVSAEESGVAVKAEGEGTLDLFQKLKAKVKAYSDVIINKEEIKVEETAELEVNGEPVASETASILYNDENENPQGSFKGELLGNEIGDGEYFAIPVVSFFKNLINKLAE